MSDQPQIPYIECPVRGKRSTYYVLVAGSKDSTEWKYRVRGTFYSEKKDEDIIILSISVSSDCPNKVAVLFVNSNGVADITYGNDIVPVESETGLRASMAKSAAEGELMDVLHHGYSFYIKEASKKTYTYHAVGVSKGVRGNAYYKLHKAWRDKHDGLIHFEVHNNRNPDTVFELTAKGISQGQWHRVPDKLCPVEGPDPSEA